MRLATGRQSDSREASESRIFELRRRAAWLVFLVPVLWLGAAPPARSQSQTMSKVPGLKKKFGSGGPTQQVFTGSIQSFDSKLHVLNVSANGTGTAIFPIQRKIKVASISGRKLKVAALTPGANVIVYYQQKGGRRTVERIVVISPGTTPTKKKSHLRS